MEEIYRKDKQQIVKEKEIRKKRRVWDLFPLRFSNIQDKQ